MPELEEARRMLELAERAAIDDDFSKADELLTKAARIQEAVLGPLHPDLANTLNNLAIVAEKTGRPIEAETFYRRAAAIASTSLPADHPMVAESRRNLETFCRDRGLPPTTDVITPSAQDLPPGREPLGPTIASVPAETSDAHAPAPTTQPQPPAPRRSLRPRAWVAIGAIALATVAVIVQRPWSSRDVATATPTAAQSTSPALSRPPLPVPISAAPPPSVVPLAENPAVVAEAPPVPAPSPGSVSLVTAELCQTFSTSGGRWRCDPPGDAVALGPIVFYTRIRSSRDATVVHRWYREDILRRDVRLTIRANVSEGYRTYSRQTIGSAGSWQVQVVSADGTLLHEQRFTVR